MAINQDHVGKALKAARLEVGLTLAEVHQKTLMDISGIYAIETGVVAPSFNFMLELCSIYEVEPHTLMYLAAAIEDTSLPLCSTIMIEGILDNLGTNYERK